MIRVISVTDYKLNDYPAPHMKNVLVQTANYGKHVKNANVDIGWLRFDTFPLMNGMNIEFSGRDVQTLEDVTVKGQIIAMKRTQDKAVYERITIVGWIHVVSK